MPLFFVAAGWLYKEKPILSYMKHRFYTVMVPYFSFGAITLIYWQFIERRFRASDMSFFQAVIGLLRGEFAALDFNVHLWFLPCFFLTVVIYNILRNLAGRKWTYVIVVLLSMVYLIDAYTQVGFPSLSWGLDRVFKYIGFYAIGNWLSEKEVEKSVKLGNKARWAALATAFLVIVFVLALFNLTSGILWFVTGTIGTMAVAMYSILISESTIISGITSFLGCISLVVLCVHGPVYRVVSKILSVLLRNETDVVKSNIVIAVIISVITLVICSVSYIVIDKILPWVIGKPIRRDGNRVTQ